MAVTNSAPDQKSDRWKIQRTLAPRFFLALLVLEVTWLTACELLRETVPQGLAAFLLFGLVPLGTAFCSRLPPGRNVTLVLLAGLFLLDVLADAWVPPHALRYAQPGWELARLATLALGARLGTARAVRAPMGQALLLALRTFVLLVIVAAAGFAVDGLWRGTRDETERADAALVLGFALDHAGRPRPELVIRVRHGAELYHHGWINQLVLSGGVPQADVTEADAMRAIALSLGVPDRALVLDRRSRNTRENFAYSAPLLHDLGASRVLVVTEPYHLPRALVLARRYGLRAKGSPAIGPNWHNLRWASYLVFREVVPTFVERVCNWIIWIT